MLTHFETNFTIMPSQANYMTPMENQERYLRIQKQELGRRVIVVYYV